MIYNHYKSGTLIIQPVLFRILLSIKDAVVELFSNFSFFIRFYRLSFLTFKTLRIVLYLHNNIRPSSATLLLTTEYSFEYLFTTCDTDIGSVYCYSVHAAYRSSPPLSPRT